MADAWGGSWGSSWGASWGLSVVPAVTDRGGDGFAGGRAERRARYVRNRHFVIRKPEPVAPGPGEEPRKVTKAVVRDAVAQVPEWFGTLAQARQAVPRTVPVLIVPEERSPSTEYVQLVEAVKAYIEQAIRDFEQAEEDDIELLLLAA